jgi:methylmalonyl-CoA/ethylmalonyl-CoA epimerase
VSTERSDPAPSRLHHVVFAVAPQRHQTVMQMFTELGFTFQEVELTELGLHVYLDWTGGLELITALPNSTAPVAVSVNAFLDSHGDGVYTVVLGVPQAAAAETTTERYGSTTRFRQAFSGEGSYLDEIELSVLGLPVTLLATNVP